MKQHPSCSRRSSSCGRSPDASGSERGPRNDAHDLDAARRPAARIPTHESAFSPLGSRQRSTSRVGSPGVIAVHEEEKPVRAVASSARPARSGSDDRPRSCRRESEMFSKCYGSTACPRTVIPAVTLAIEETFTARPSMQAATTGGARRQIRDAQGVPCASAVAIAVTTGRARPRRDDAAARERSCRMEDIFGSTSTSSPDGRMIASRSPGSIGRLMTTTVF